MENSTYELLLKNLKEKTDKQAVDSSEQDKSYYASRMASQQLANQQQRQQQNTLAQQYNARNVLSDNTRIDIFGTGQKYQVTQEETKEQNEDWWSNFWGKTFGIIDELAAKFGSGFVSFWEGIVDKGATAIGSIGDATGWYSSKPFTDWAKQDIATNFAEWTKTYANLTPWGIGNMIYQSIDKGGDYWKGMAEGARDLFDASLFGITGDGGALNKDYRADADKYYKYNDELETGVGQFAGGVANSIGFMVPSIMLGNAAGAGAKAFGATTKGVDAARQAGTLASMYLGASGKATEEALNEGASASGAYKYGIASGAVEVASEIVVGKALGVAGLGTGKILGVVGGETAKVGSKSFVKEMAKDMFEEGMEEVFSGLLEPITKMTYKGSDALYDEEGRLVYSTGEYWFGSNGHFNESILGQFTSGAVTAGIMGGSQKVMNKVSLTKKVGADGYKMISKYQEIMQADADLLGMDKSNAKYNSQYEYISQLTSEFIELEDTFLKNANEAQIKNMAGLLTDPNTLATYVTDENTDITETLKEHLSEFGKQRNTYEKRYIRNFFEDVQNRYGTDYELKFGKVNNDDYASVDRTNKVITINDNVVNEKGGALLAHEYFAHVLGDYLGQGDRGQFYTEIKSTDWYKENADKLKKAYADDFKNLNEADQTALWKDEVIANYFEDIFNEEDVTEQVKHLEQVFKKPNIIQKFFEAIGIKKDEFKSPNILKEYAKVVNRTFDAIKKIPNAKYHYLVRALLKYKEGKQLAANELKLMSKYKKLFELVNMLKNGGTPKQQVAYSKNKVYNEFGWEQSRYNEIEKNTNKSNYRHHNWAIVNHSITQKENAQLAKLVGDLHRGEIFPKSSITNDYMFEVENKIVFSDGVYNNFSINKIIEIVDLKDIEIIKENIYYDEQNNVVYEENENLFKNYSRDDSTYEVWQRGRKVQGSNANNQGSENGAGSNQEVRYSKRLAKDSEGRTLTEAQQEYFKDSKIRDENGNLLVVYHGTDADFTVFDVSKGRSFADIQGSFFSPWELDSRGYGKNVKTYYLNIKNPADWKTAYKALEMFKTDNQRGIKAREYLKSLGYDGVNNENEEYIAFYPEQIKLIDNAKPTSNPDIRYSKKALSSKDSVEITPNDEDNSFRVIKDETLDETLTDIAGIESNEELEEVSDYLNDMLDELEDTEDVDGVYKRFTKEFTALFNKILPQIKELQSFYDNFKIGKVIDTEMFSKTASLENLMGELNTLYLINDDDYVDMINSKAVKKAFKDTIEPILEQSRVIIPNDVLKTINERLQAYAKGTTDLAGEELRAIAEANEKENVKELRQKALDKFEKVKDFFQHDKNISANNYSSMTRAGITNKLTMVKEFDTLLNDYKQELINNGVTKSVADDYISALQDNELKYVYEVKLNLDNAYAIKYAPTDAKVDEKLEEIKQNKKKQDKTELGETVANTLTNALEGTKFVFDYNAEIIDNIKSTSTARKSNLKSKLINGMSIVRTVTENGKSTMKATKLTDLATDNTLRVSAEAYIGEVVDWLFRKNSNVSEVNAMVKALKQQIKDKDSSLKQANKELAELKKQNENYRKEQEKYNKDVTNTEKAIKELADKNLKGTEKYDELVKKVNEFKETIKELSEKIKQNVKIYNKSLEGYHESLREMLKQNAKLERDKIRITKRVYKAWEVAAQEKINAKGGKYKVGRNYLYFLQEVGKVISGDENFEFATKRSADLIAELMSHFDEEHKVTFTARDVKEGNYVSKTSTWEATMTKAEIALNYYWNFVMGNEIASPYIYEESWQAITEQVKELYDYTDEDIDFINKTIIGLATTEETDFAKEQRANLDAHNRAMANQKAKLERIIAKVYDKYQYEQSKYLHKVWELRTFKHALQAKQRILSYKKRVEAYKYKFGRLSGMPEGYYDMVTKLHEELSKLSVNQIANGEYLNALDEFYNSWKQIEKDIEKWNSDPNQEHPINIEMADELKQLIELTLAETDVTNMGWAAIDRFAKCIVGIKGFLTEAKEHRTIVINGEVRALEDISLEGVKEQQKLNELTANKTRSGKERFGFASSWLNPQVIFDKLSGYQRDGIFNKIYDMLLEGQDKYAENYMTLAMPFAEFKKKYRKEYNSLKKTFEGTLEVDGQKFEDVTIGQVITLYETIKRMHAQQHFKSSGITFGDGKKIVFDYTTELDNEIDEIFKKSTTVDYDYVTAEQMAEVKRILKEGVNKRTVKDLEKITKELNKALNLSEEVAQFTYDDVKDIEKKLKDTITKTLDNKILKLQSDIEKALNLNEGSPYAEYIKIVDDFFKQARELKVEADKEILGFTNVSDDYYFPISVSKLDTQTNFGTQKSTEEMNARQYAFNQDIVSTMGSLLIYNVDDIIERHMKNISMYNGFSPKIENFERIYNWKQARGVTIKNTTAQRFGTDAGKVDKFFDTLIRDIQGASYGMSNTETTFNSIVNMFRGNAITTALGMNPKVWVSQLASLPAAMKYISLSNIIKGSKNILGNVKGLPEMPSLGMYRRFNSDIIRSETVTAKGEVNKIAEATTKPIQLFDSGAINSIWYASLLETQNKDGSWNIEKATEVFVKTVNETQPNYNALGRPEILRNNNPLLRMFVMYKTQSFQNFSNAYSAISRLVYKIRRGIPLDETIRDANGKIISYGDKDKAVRSLIALFLQGVLFTAIGYLFKRIINNDWGQDTGEHLAKDFGIQFINDNILGIMPVIDKLQIDLDQKFFLKLNINGWTDTYTDTLEKLIKWENMAPKDWVSIFSMFTGLPVNNTYKYAKSILQYILPEKLVQKIDVGYRGKTVNKQLISNTTNGKLSLTYYNIYNKDINNGLNDSARKEMYRLYKAGNTSVILKSVPTTITSDGVEYSVVPEQFNQVYSKVGTQINNLVSSSNYAKLSDEEKSWQLQKLIDTYHSASKKAVTNEDFTKYESLAFYGFDFTSDLLSRYLYITNIEGTKRAKKSQLVQRYINTSRISIGEKYLLWWLSGYSLKDNQKAVLRRYLLQNGVTSSSLKEIVK